MNAIIDAARSTGIKRITLEVIVGNESAYRLYQPLGFETLRRLLIVGCDQIQSPASGGDAAIKTIGRDDALAHYETLHTAPNPWQRQPPSIDPDVGTWGIYRGDDLRAYVMARVTPQRIIFIDAAGESSALRTLLTHVHRAVPAGVFVNLAEDDPAWPILAAMGYQERVSQYEMALSLRVPGSAAES